MDTTATAGEAPVPAEAPLHARGGISIGGAITGALVVYAAALLFTLATRAVASYAGYRPYLLPIGGTHGVGLTAAAGIGAGLLLQTVIFNPGGLGQVLRPFTRWFAGHRFSMHEEHGDAAAAALVGAGDVRA